MVPTWAARQDIRGMEGNPGTQPKSKRGMFPIHRIEDSPLLSTQNEDDERISLHRQVYVSHFTNYVTAIDMSIACQHENLIGTSKWLSALFTESIVE